MDVFESRNKIEDYSFQVPWKFSALSTRTKRSSDDQTRLLNPLSIPSCPPALAVMNSSVSEGECHRTFGTENGQRMVDESTLNLIVLLHGTTQTRCIVVRKTTDNVVQSSTKSLVISFMPSRTIVWHIIT